METCTARTVEWHYRYASHENGSQCAVRKLHMVFPIMPGRSVTQHTRKRTASTQQAHSNRITRQEEALHTYRTLAIQYCTCMWTHTPQSHTYTPSAYIETDTSVDFPILHGIRTCTPIFRGSPWQYLYIADVYALGLYARACAHVYAAIRICFWCVYFMLLRRDRVQYVF